MIKQFKKEKHVTWFIKMNRNVEMKDKIHHNVDKWFEYRCDVWNKKMRQSNEKRWNIFKIKKKKKIDKIENINCIALQKTMVQ